MELIDHSGGILNVHRSETIRANKDALGPHQIQQVPKGFGIVSEIVVMESAKVILKG